MARSSVLPLEDAFVLRLIGRGASAHCCPHCPAECCGAYAIGATAPPALSAGIRRPLGTRRARDCSERPPAAATLLRRAGDLEDAVAEPPDRGRAVRRRAEQSRPAPSAVVGRKRERARRRPTNWS